MLLPVVRFNSSNPELQVYVAVDPLNRLLVVITMPFVGSDKEGHWPTKEKVHTRMLGCNYLSLLTNNCETCCLYFSQTISSIWRRDISGTPVLAFIITTQWVEGESSCLMNPMLWSRSNSVPSDTCCSHIQ